MAEDIHVKERPPWLRALRAVSKVLALTAAVLSGVGILILSVMTLANIYMRNAGQGGFPDMVGWGEVGVAMFAYLGLAYAQRKDAHVSTIVLVRLLSRKGQLRLRAVWLSIAVVLLAWISYETTKVAIESVERLEQRFGTVPVWPAKVAIAAAMLLLLFELIVQLLDTLVGTAEVHGDINHPSVPDSTRPDHRGLPADAPVAVAGATTERRTP